MADIPFVERKFELDGDNLIVRFDTPLQVTDDQYECRWTIGWPKRERQFHAFGIDSVQALTLAMRMVHCDLLISKAYKTGKLTLFGNKDLDLPPI